VPDVLEPAAQDRGRKYVRNPASIRHAFPDLTTHQAAEVITYWMHTSLFLLREDAMPQTEGEEGQQPWRERTTCGDYEL
jgi:hypothetical protein